MMGFPVRLRAGDPPLDFAVPDEMMRAAQKQLYRNHGRSFDELRRIGLSVCEILAAIERRSYDYAGCREACGCRDRLRKVVC